MSVWSNKLKRFFNSDIGFVIMVFLVWRISLFFLAYCGFYQIANPDALYSEFDYGTFWNMWARWDGWHYIRNAVRGYIPDQPFTAFFPLYPLAIQLVYKVMHINPVASGLLISNLSILLTGLVLIKLVKMDFSQEIARRTFLYLLIFPAGVFLAAVYTESLFLLCTISTFYFARKKKWVWAGLCGFFASLTRNQGFLIFIPLLIELFKEGDIKGLSGLFKKKVFLVILLPILGLLIYMFFLWLKFDDPFKFIHDQRTFGRRLCISFPKKFIKSIRYLWRGETGGRYFWNILEISSFWIFFISIFFVIKRIRLSYGVWMFLLLLPIILSNTLISVNRFVITLFPVFILFSQLGENRLINDFIIFISSIFLGLYTILFTHYFWVG